MSCCAPGVETGFETRPDLAVEEIRLASRDLGNGSFQTTLAVPAMHCGSCIHTVEKALGALDGVEYARANLTARRVAVQWRSDTPPPMIEALEDAGFASHLYEPQADSDDRVLKRLLRALAVAGFAAGNIMLLSVSVWSGAEAATRDLFHWISALIALPALAYSGRIFFSSAWRALRAGRLNMDVPISLAILLAFVLSLYETANHGGQAYFDAAVTLMFFLLIGRTLDHVMRRRTRSAVTALARLTPRGAVRVDPDGGRRFVSLDLVRPADRLFVAAGERIPVDGTVVDGRSDLDGSIVNGESQPQATRPGEHVYAGMLNLSGPLTIAATAAADDSFLAEMQRLMQAAESGEARYRHLADRAAGIYAPAVHLAAALTFIAWYAFGAGLHQSVFTAITVLIITCPCALGLAVPVVQVVAARRLFENGIMVKDGAAIERIAECDTAVFDKTGTLTVPRRNVANTGNVPERELGLAAALAANSSHPLSRAIAEAGKASPRESGLRNIVERPGLGIEARQNGSLLRLGRKDWALQSDGPDRSGNVVLSRDGSFVAEFEFDTVLKPDVAEALTAVRDLGLAIEILSGDRAESTGALAATLAIDNYAGEVLPAEKLERIEALTRNGHRVLMVGDGINDAPALSAAHASMAPATAADIGRSAAGFVYLRDSLMAVPTAIAVARRAGRLIRQNFALAIVYNLVAVPAAALGFVTPLIAALAMSLSSVAVTLNAMRLSAPAIHPAGNRPGEQDAPVAFREQTVAS